MDARSPRKVEVARSLDKFDNMGPRGGRNILVGFIVRPSLMKCHNRSVKHDASNRTINRLEVDGFIRWSRMYHMVYTSMCS